MDRTLLLTVAVTAILLTAGCASTQERSEPFDGSNEPNDSAAGTTTGSDISQLDIYAAGENLDNDTQKELGVIIYGKDAQGQDTRFSGSLHVQLERKVSTTYETVFEATTEVSESDFISGENLLGDIRTGFARHFDDDQIISGQDYRLTATLTHDAQTSEATEEIAYFIDEAEDQAPPDDGAYVTRAGVSTTSENVDSDAPSEAIISVEGTDDQENALTFTGNLHYVLLRNAGDYSDEHWVKETEGDHTVAPSDFDSDFISTSYSFVLDDTKLVDSEDYKLQVNLTVDQAGQTFTTIEDVLFYDDAENQSEPARAYSDRGDEVTHISVYAHTDNRDGDAADEGLVEIEGKDRDDSYVRFAGTLDILLEREAGDYQNTYYEHVDEWTVQVGPNDFNGSFAPAHTFVIDDDKLQTSESYTTYRVTVTATMDANGQSFSDRGEIFYSGD